MKKLNRILSSALVLVFIFTALIAAIPFTAGAAYVEQTERPSLSKEQIQEIVNKALTYDFETAEQMLLADMAVEVSATDEGGNETTITVNCLDSASSSDGKYTIFVNRYTGVMYYRNNLTSQILTSNPYDLSDMADTEKQELLSQISITFANTTGGVPTEYNSTIWAALYGQISTEYIKSGIRVNYTLGDTAKRFLLPGRIKAEKFEEMLLRPMIEQYEDIVIEYCSELTDDDLSFFENENYNAITELHGHINTSSLKSNPGLKAYFNNITKSKFYSQLKTANVAAYNELQALHSEIMDIIGYYSLKDPLQEKADGSNATYESQIKDYYTPAEGVSPDLEIFTTYEPMYVGNVDKLDNIKRDIAEVVRKYAKEYTFSEMYADEKECGYVDASAEKPVFRCALEYSFNTDGTLSVRLPANSITFDELTYNLTAITPLRYFGAGDMSEDGYIFYPDGSGTIVEFEDFYNDSNKANLSYKSQPFGKDYCYSRLTGAHKAQITMPVYGVVGKVTANASTAAALGLSNGEKVTNGYLAILEEGSPLANLEFTSGGNKHKYASAFSSYTPYPSDIYDLSETISVGEATEYTIVSKSGYTGSYVTRIVMLADEKVGDELLNGSYYPASYTGMANYYRDYLVGNGTLSALDSLKENLPLYIEALGSMEIITKFLSFPITTKIPLTTFDNVLEIYQDLAGATAKIQAKADEYQAKADAEEDVVLKEQYQESADLYSELAENIVDIDNVNFRLTGFGNGGMYYTYPTKVRWDKACGGEKAFKKLIEEAKKVSDAGANFGIYPDYDFMYINNTEWFDGIIVRGNVSRMVDNRYASKQTYNSAIQKFESFFTLVINPASLERLYEKFLGQYSKFDVKSISVSTMGSDLNSNFDEDEPVNRDDAKNNVASVLARMKSESGYDIMTDTGNQYTLKYTSHILNFATDSSHISYSSYTIPFTGMVLHGYVNYAGSPLNYSGSPSYDMLRAIESGASIYYILCCQNTSYMKDDELLSKYYGVDYSNWYEGILESYAEINAAIGDLQDYNIVDHKIIKGERVIEESEIIANYKTLKAELLVMLAEQLENAVTEGYAYLKEHEVVNGTPLVLDIDEDAILSQFAELLDLELTELEDDGFADSARAIIADYSRNYPAGGTNPYVVSFDEIEYNSKYSFMTDSLATDEDYKYTDYTSDSGNISLVTYKKGNEIVRFILNYNIYSVTVRLADGEEYTLPKHGYVRI